MPTFNAAAVGSTWAVEIRFNQVDVQNIRRRVLGIPNRIDKGLWARAREMAAVGVRFMDDEAPKGEGGDWARGDPPLSQGNSAFVQNPYMVVLFTRSPHARYIHDGFAPHMPPEEAWLGEEELSFIMRRQVGRKGTPNNPDPYIARAGDRLGPYNLRLAQEQAAQVIPK